MSLYLLAACSTGVSLMVVNSAVDCVDTASDTCRGWKVIVTACTTETHDIFSLYLIGGLPSFFLSSLVSVVPPPPPSAFFFFFGFCCGVVLAPCSGARCFLPLTKIQVRARFMFTFWEFDSGVVSLLYQSCASYDSVVDCPLSIIFASVHLPTYLPTYLPACLPAYVPTYLPTHLSTYQPTNQPTD